MEGFWRFLFGHPFVKAIGLGLFGILGNVLAGFYVFEITKNDAKHGQFLDWRATPHTQSFWALAAVLVLMGLYGWGAARFERKIRRALTENDVRERVLEEMLAPLLENAKREIRDGKIRTLDEVMAMFRVENRGSE